MAPSQKKKWRTLKPAIQSFLNTARKPPPVLYTQLIPEEHLKLAKRNALLFMRAYMLDKDLESGKVISATC